MIRDFTLKDLSDLEKFSKFPLDNLKMNSNYPITGSIIDNKTLLGSFFVHITTEISFILNDDLSKLSKSKAITEIFNYLNKELSRRGFDDAHVFIKDDKYYADLLRKHFGFEDVIGTPLVIRRR